MAHTTSSRDEIFLKYVLIESGRAIRHFDKTFQLASEVSVTPVGESREFLSVLDALHAGLHFYANVSRVFWPPKGSRREESSQKLRTLCDLADDHLMSNRRLRDHVEHMDERIEDWTTNGRIPYLTYEMVDYFPEDALNTPIKDVTLLIYNAVSREVRIRGEVYKIDNLRRAVLDVQQKASAGFGKLIAQWPSQPDGSGH